MKMPTPDAATIGRLREIAHRFFTGDAVGPQRRRNA